MYRIHGFFTQNTMKTLYVLEELEADFEFQFVNLGQGENRTDEFRALTPIGKVPVLEHDGETLFESGAICRYAASNEKSPLFPADKLERARVDQWMTFFSCHPGRWLTEIYFEKVIKPVAGMGEPNQEACARATKFAHQQLNTVDHWLEGKDWLANDAFSIAEPYALAYLEQTLAIDFSLDEHPRVKAWFDRLNERDGVARARARVQPYLRSLG
jgi:glutathione S-transferase